MSADRCPLTWKAEALEDGRLDGADRASFEDHASRCAECGAARKALAAFDAKMRELPPASLSRLDHARRRGMLLDRANERFVARPRAARARWAVLAVVILVLAGASALVARGGGGAPSAIANEADMAPRYQVLEGAHAVWRTAAEGTVSRVDLADGSATFRVERLVPPQRFLLSLPDGDVEATGTRFTVDVTLGRTRSVAVAEGHVVFRRRHEREMTLHAGEGWSRAEPIADRSYPDPTVTRAPAASALVPSATSPSAMPSAQVRPSASNPLRPRAAASSAAAPRAGKRFDEAVARFVHGAYAEADVEFHAFMEEFPYDARCEDASFLSAVARWRMGDQRGARLRAESYLAAYPNGLRGPEARHILDDAR